MEEVIWMLALPRKMPLPPLAGEFEPEEAAEGPRSASPLQVASDAVLTDGSLPTASTATPLEALSIASAVLTAAVSSTAFTGPSALTSSAIAATGASNLVDAGGPTISLTSSRRVRSSRVLPWGLTPAR